MVNPDLCFGFVGGLLAAAFVIGSIFIVFWIMTKGGKDENHD